MAHSVIKTIKVYAYKVQNSKMHKILSVFEQVQLNVFDFGCIVLPITKSTYRISRNIDSDFNLAIWRLHKDRQINSCHYRSIFYTTSMGFSTYSAQNRQFKIPPTAFLSKPPNIMFANNSTYTVLHSYRDMYYVPYSLMWSDLLYSGRDIKGKEAWLCKISIAKMIVYHNNAKFL